MRAEIHILKKQVLLGIDDLMDHVHDTISLQSKNARVIAENEHEFVEKLELLKNKEILKIKKVSIRCLL